MIGSVDVFRHEFKYPINRAQEVLLRARAEALLQPDAHVGKDGLYHIRSAYFDDVNDTCYYENENGVDPREKFRIRIYNGSDDYIRLECKRKENGKTGKKACPLSRAQAEKLLAGEPVPLAADAPPLLRKFLLQVALRGLMPVVTVDYDRVPLVNPLGNTRVTFDRNLSASDRIDRFFDGKEEGRAVLPVGYGLMEVKYDAFLPDAVYRALDLGCLQASAFSKYYLCRKLYIFK